MWRKCEERIQGLCMCVRESVFVSSMSTYTSLYERGIYHVVIKAGGLFVSISGALARG